MNEAGDIQVLVDRGAAFEALEAEHASIDSALETFKEAIFAGADCTVVSKILDSVIQFCSVHFTNEENFMRDGGYEGLTQHAESHHRLLEKFTSVRAVISESTPLAVLDAVDLLYAFHKHTDTGDKAVYEHFLRTSEQYGVNAVHRTNELASLARVSESRWPGVD